MSDEPIRYRISKSTRRHMVAVGLFFDILPIVVLIIALVMVFQGVSLLGTECAKATAGNLADKVLHGVGCVWHVGVKITAAVSTALALISFGPLILGIASFLTNILFIGVFTIWFMVHNVFMWSARPKRIVINFLTFIGEFIPALNILLPGCTIAVLLHIHAAREEDRKKATEQKRETQRAERGAENGAFENVPEVAPA